jgi:amino-acid N-acetyltransferase
VTSNVVPAQSFVEWFRAVAPYIHAFRGRTFVIAFGGEVVADHRRFVALAHDLNLLVALGVKMVLVHGARAQIEARLAELGHATPFVAGKRVTDAVGLRACKEASGRLRVEIEALLSLGLPNSPMAGADIHVASGNFVTARPVGVIEGVDLEETGEVRKIDAAAIRARLDQGELVLMSPLGYSPTGEVFNVTLEDVATSTAIALGAEKLIFLMEGPGVTTRGGSLVREMTASQAERTYARKRGSPDDTALYLPCAVRALRSGVRRAHLISREADDALLTELFTHKGSGTMVTQDTVERFREAKPDDVGAILRLIEPLERDGTLVRRGRQLIEREIDRFAVLEHDRMLIGCAALYPFQNARTAELACFTIHADYRRSGVGARFLALMEARARKRRLKRLFVLTTRTEHWFVEQGFIEASVDALPDEKKALYNYRRNSKVLFKAL